MPKERKVSYRAQFDGHRRLAAAVILQAIKDSTTTSSDEEREMANKFLSGDMWPFSDVLDLQLDGKALNEFLQEMPHIDYSQEMQEIG